MKDTLHFILIIAITFTLSLLTSALLDIDWIKLHWLRQSLVIMLIALQVVVGSFVFYRKVKGMAVI